jgi:hypothetical protein
MMEHTAPAGPRPLAPFTVAGLPASALPVPDRPRNGHRPAPAPALAANTTGTRLSVAQLRRFQWAVRAALAVGVAASVCANVLHARDNPISQAIAAWPPLALLLTVELVSRVPVHRRLLAFARIGGTAVIAGIAVYVSYFHMAAVVSRYGEHQPNPYLLPLSVDGLIVVASVSLVELSGRVRAALEQPAVPVVDSAAVQGAAVPVEAVLTPPAEGSGADQAATAERERPRLAPEPAPPSSRSTGPGPASATTTTAKVAVTPVSRRPFR